MTLVKGVIEVDANILTKSVTMMVNSTMEIALEVVYGRNLDPSYLISRSNFLEESFWVWFQEETLEVVRLEIFPPENPSTDAYERWDFPINYSDDPNPEVRRAPADDLKRFCESLNSLPPGATYRFVVGTAEGAKEIPGWTPTTLRALHPTNEMDFDETGYGYISGKVFYMGGTW
jgi:hypothetical protein